MCSMASATSDGDSELSDSATVVSKAAVLGTLLVVLQPLTQQPSALALTVATQQPGQILVTLQPLLLRLNTMVGIHMA